MHTVLKSKDINKDPTLQNLESSLPLFSPPKQKLGDILSLTYSTSIKEAKREI